LRAHCFIANATRGKPDLPTGPPLKRVKILFVNKPSAWAEWTPEEIARGKRWLETWRLVNECLERIRRKEIRELDTYQAILDLCYSTDYSKPPYAPKPWSGLVELQQWFKKAAEQAADERR
jgi:hypothetical protein